MMTSNLTVDVTHSIQATLILSADVEERRRVLSSLPRLTGSMHEFIVLQQKVSIFTDNNASPEWICNCALNIR